MRILLDAHISGSKVGGVLREDGHDVRAIDEEPDLEGLEDQEVLELAASEGRILVTANVRDFIPLLAQKVGGGRSHAGCILVPRSVRGVEFGTLIAGIRGLLSDSRQVDWLNRVEWLRKK